MTRFLFLIPLLPLLGFVLNFAFGVRLMRRRLGLAGPGLGRWPGPAGDARRGRARRRGPTHDAGHHASADAHGGGHARARARRRPSSASSPAAPCCCRSCSRCYAVWQAHHAPGHTLVETLWTWVPGGAAETAAGAAPFVVDWAYQVDPLSSVMLLVVTFVGFCIHVYSTGYMSHDPGYARFMSYLNLFMFAMLTLVLGANYLMLFVGWEGVGLCSYLLIGFWFDRKSASDAGKKAFIVNRIGDAGFVLGHVPHLRDLRQPGLPDRDRGRRADARGVGVVGAADHDRRSSCSSAPAARARRSRSTSGCPTPWKARPRSPPSSTPPPWSPPASTWSRAPSAIYAHAPKAMMVVAVVGALTAILAATIALVQNDIKRVLAYSTVSQLGYMFLACGVGAFGAGVFHLMTHAFFKALLFLGSGSVIHGMSRGAGHAAHGRAAHAHAVDAPHHARSRASPSRGSRPWPASSPRTRSSGRRSRSAATGRWCGRSASWSRALTAFYMFRLYHRTFSGEFRGTDEQDAHVHESPASMIVPLQVLAVGTVLAGLVGIPALLGELPRCSAWASTSRTSSSTSWSRCSSPRASGLAEVFSTAAPAPRGGVHADGC